MDNEECNSGACINFSSRAPSSNLLESKDADEEEISWTVRHTINNKLMLQAVSGLMEALLWEIDHRWSNFLYHAFINHQQRKYIESIR